MNEINKMIEQQRSLSLKQRTDAISEAQRLRDGRTTKRGNISSFADGGAWVAILPEDGGGEAFVTIDVDKAAFEGKSITVNGDRGYF